MRIYHGRRGRFIHVYLFAISDQRRGLKGGGGGEGFFDVSDTSQQILLFSTSFILCLSRDVVL